MRRRMTFYTTLRVQETANGGEIQLRGSMYPTTSTIFLLTLKNSGEMKRKYNFFNSLEFERLVPYLVLLLIYAAIIAILYAI